ncbi:MAG: glycoside hydrolase family 2 TIM barrel-domain containing protein, partial [bacterium]
MDVQIDLGNGWFFRRGRAGRGWAKSYDDADCVTVDLPHSWNLDDTFQEGVDYYRGHGAYKRTFILPTAPCGSVRDGTWVLESEGFYGTGDVWLNSRKVADVDGEFLGFRLDVGGFVQPGTNLLAVRLTNNCRSFVLPGIKMPDFLLHGGLAGRVFLRWEPAVSLVMDGIRIDTAVMPGQPVIAGVTVQVRNTTAVSVDTAVRLTIIDPSGREAGSATIPATNVPAGGTLSPAETRFEIPRPELWSPGRPSLYVCRCELLRGSMVADVREKRFGLRSAVFEPGRGFFLNGERVELRGCNRHENMPGFGGALPVAMHREDARLLRETGCNIVRLSHYPQHPAFLDACDELGLMVYAEIASWKSVRTGRWLRRALRQMERMILRDRHRPSIILWGMGNESRSRRAYRELGSLAKSLDPARPVTYAENHLYRAVREKTLDLADVWGCNYEIEALEAGCAASRLRATIVSEVGNMPTAARGDLQEELKQVQVIEQDLARMEGKEFNSGCVIWCMNDYATMRKRRYLRYSGIFDAWRLPKMARAFLMARWADDPNIHVYGDWAARAGRDGPGGGREIHVFSNCRSVVLLRNGREIASAEGKPHLVFCVEFEEGQLEARGIFGGQSVSDSLRSPGPACRIHVTGIEITPRTGGRPLWAVDIMMLDCAGVLCSDWHGTAVVSVAGDARLFAFTPDGVIPVSGGVGRTFVLGSGGGSSATVEVVCQAVAAG